MAVERTLSIIKPDAVSKNVIGQIYTRFEQAGLKIVASRMTHLTEKEAGGFYAVHSHRPFFKDLVSFMISGPVVIQVLEGEDAIAKHRDIMGATTRRRPLRARSVRTSRTRSTRTPCTVPTAPRTPPSRSRTSSAPPNCRRAPAEVARMRPCRI